MVNVYIPPYLLAAVFALIALAVGYLVIAVCDRTSSPRLMRIAVLAFAALSCNAIIQSGASSDQWTIDATSKAGRVTNYDSAGRELSVQSKQTFSCSNTFTPAATPTDLVTLTGSASKTIRVISAKLSTQNTAAGSQQFFLIKRSGADTTGTFVTSTAVAHDSSNAAATATCGHYTANPGALGTAVGTIATERWASPVLVPGNFAGVTEDSGKEFLNWSPNSVLDQMITLRGTSQVLAVNFNGAALVAGQVHAYRVTWIEE